jgi:glutamate/aspartate transport system substrate-binding protein
MRNRIAILAVSLALCCTQPASAQNFTGTLKRIQDTGTVAIGHRESSVPFSYVGDDGKPQGYTIDLCLKLVDGIKKEIGRDVLKIRWVPVNPQTRIPLVANGTIQLECGSTTNTLTRQEQVDYTHTTFVTGAKLLVKKGAGIAGIRDMGGKTVAIALGTTTEKAIKREVRRLNLDVRILDVEDHAEGFQALESDRADAYSTDHILLHGLIRNAQHPQTYQVVGDFLSYDPYAIMLPRDDSAFRLVANRQLSDLFRSGEIEDIYNRWFDSLGVPVTDLLVSAFILQALPR